MFMGEFHHALDPKGRVFIPAKLRDTLGEKCVVTRGLDQCLFVYTESEWASVERKLKQLPMTQSDARAFVRFFFSGAVNIDLDKQGRVMLPVNLREYASLDKDAVIIGVSSRIEIWSKEMWEKYMTNAAESFEAIAEKIVDLGI